MTYRECYEQGCRTLQAAGIEEAALDARLLLEAVCGTDRNDLLVHGEQPVAPEAEEKYLNWIRQRAEHIPLQQLTGEQGFMGLTFSVNEHVLIPRQDTEILVEEVLKELHDGMRVLDMCTGSGCILLSLLHYSNDCDQASQKFLFYNRYRLFFHGIHKEVSRIKKSICLLYLPLIFKRDRINIPSAKSEGLGCTPQCIKCTVNPCHKKQKCFHRHGPFRFQCLIDPAYHKSCEIQSQNGFRKKASFFQAKSKGCHKKSAAAMDQYSSRKNNLKRYTKKQAGYKRSKGSG